MLCNRSRYSYAMDHDCLWPRSLFHAQDSVCVCLVAIPSGVRLRQSCGCSTWLLCMVLDWIEETASGIHCPRDVCVARTNKIARKKTKQSSELHSSVELIDPWIIWLQNCVLDDQEVLICYTFLWEPFCCWWSCSCQAHFIRQQNFPYWTAEFCVGSGGAQLCWIGQGCHVTGEDVM